MFTDDLSLEDFEEEIGEMAHLWTTESGLPYEVLIDYLGKYRKFGSRVIPSENKEDSNFDFSPEELDILEQVNSVYGHFNVNELESICHQESPWKIARANLPHFNLCTTR